MSSYKKGVSFEDFVSTVYHAILEAESSPSNYQSIELQRRKIITSKSGTPAEIDIYWEFEQAGITHSVAIECKNHRKNVSIGAVRDFARKISDLSGMKGLMVSSTGFSKHAINEAQADNIDLLVIRPQQTEDWEGRLREIHINLNYQSPARFIGMRTFFNSEWAEANGFPAGSEITVNAMDNEILIVDDTEGFRQSLHELQAQSFYAPEKLGQHTWIKTMSDGWLVVESSDDEARYKLDRIEIDYIKPPAIKDKIVVDFTEQALAVMEYVSGETQKYLVLKNGERKLF